MNKKVFRISVKNREHSIEEIKSAIEELVDLLVECKVDYARAIIRDDGNCPYSFFSLENGKGMDSCDDCSNCKSDFFEKFAEQEKEEILKQYRKFL